MRDATPRRRYGDRHAASGVDQRLPAIECWPNQYQDRVGYEITIEISEYTALCPKTGLPDFGTITIRYRPRALCLELRSLKEYFLAYRHLGIFYENAVNKVLRDIAAAAHPFWAEVTGDFATRGGMRARVVARYGPVPGAPRQAPDSGSRARQR